MSVEPCREYRRLFKGSISLPIAGSSDAGRFADGAPLPADNRNELSWPLTEEELRRFLQSEGKTLGKAFLRWASSCGIGRANALEATQTVLFRLLMRIRAGRATRREITPGYLFRAGQREAFRQHRRSKTVLPVELAEVQDRPRRHQGGEVQHALGEALGNVLDRLPECDRELVLRCHGAGHCQTSSSDLLGVTQGNVSRRLACIRQRIRREVIAALVAQGFDRSELPCC
jgi:RNA polymerase sigma factor (sigma-70 family)